MDNLTMFGVTRCGKKHAENQDCIFQREIETGEMGTVYLLGVADGISGSAYGGSVARWLIERHLAQIPLFDQPTPPVGVQLEKTLTAQTVIGQASRIDKCREDCRNA